MHGRPPPDKAFSISWKTTIVPTQVIDTNQKLRFSKDGMKMRWIMFPPMYVNDDAVKLADPRHPLRADLALALHDPFVRRDLPKTDGATSDCLLSRVDDLSAHAELGAVRELG
jgi:hypothetical protein